MGKTFTLALSISLAITCCASADEPKLVGEKKIMELTDAERVYESNGMHSMRLSPDAKYLLFGRRKLFAGKSGYELVLRDIKANRNKFLPSPAHDDDFITYFLTMRPFDAGGKHIVLPADTDGNANGVMGFDKKIQIGVYNIAKAKLRTMDCKTGYVIPTFDSKGKDLVVMTISGYITGEVFTTKADKWAPKEFSKWGLIRSINPAAPIMPILIPKHESGEAKAVMALYNVRTAKKLAVLPIHRHNSKLDNYNPQWTTDGRYLYYVDFEDADNEDASGRPRRGKLVSRIWDRKKAKVVATVGDCIPVGPGPGKDTMVLVKRDKAVASGSRIFLHSPTGVEWILGDGSQRPISTQGKHIVYVRKDADGKEFICMAEISLPVKKDATKTKKVKAE